MTQEHISNATLPEIITDTLYATIDEVPEGFQIIDKDWRYVYVNRAMAKHGKSTKEQLMGKTIMECYPGIDQTPLFKKLKKCMNERISERFEYEFTFPDGTRGWFDLYIHPVAGGIAIFSIDITAQKNTELALFTKIKEVDLLMVSTVDREKKMMQLKAELAELKKLANGMRSGDSGSITVNAGV